MLYLDVLETVVICDCTRDPADGAKDGRQGGNGCSQVKIRDRKCLFCIYSLILIALWNCLGFKCLLLVHLIIESSGIIHLYSLLK